MEKIKVSLEEGRNASKILYPLRKRSPDGPRMNGGYKRENLLSHHLVILSTADVMLVKDDPPGLRMQNSSEEVKKLSALKS